MEAQQDRSLCLGEATGLRLQRLCELQSEASHGQVAVDHEIGSPSNSGEIKRYASVCIHVEDCVVSGFAGKWSWGRREGGARKVNKTSRWSLANCAENLGDDTNCSVPVSW